MTRSEPRIVAGLVKALARGYASGQIREPGDIFLFNGPLGRWMEEISPLDHDEDGRKGGSRPGAGEDIAELRAAYQQAFGKRAFPGWGADVLREKIAEKAGGAS
jgi:hypothetical protein